MLVKSISVITLGGSWSGGVWTTLLLYKTEVGIAVVSWVWICDGLGDTVQEYMSFVEVWAMLKRLDVKSFEA
jgi:hypothetical protein